MNQVESEGKHQRPGIADQNLGTKNTRLGAWSQRLEKGNPESQEVGKTQDLEGQNREVWITYMIQHPSIESVCSLFPHSLFLLCLGTREVARDGGV